MRRGVVIESGLGKERNAVAKDVGEVEKAGVPIVEAHAMDGAGHLVFIQISSHVHAENVEPAPHQGINVGRDGLGERRNENARGKRRGLVMAVENHRVPFDFGARDIARFQHVVHVAVAIVVVSDVLLIEVGQRTHFVRRSDILAIPGHHFVLTIRI